jgi:hypothetical protein
MRIIRKLTWPIKQLLRRLKLDHIPPLALLFLGGCLVLALIDFFSWRSDREVLEHGREIRADVIDRRTVVTEECEPDSFSNNCTTETSYYLTYRYRVEAGTFMDEQAVSKRIYERTESSILVRYLPDNPSVSNVAETVENSPSFPPFSIIVVFVGLLGAAIIYWKRA